jgi:glutamyl/glutaminyl-tRNA synthetase
MRSSDAIASGTWSSQNRHGVALINLRDASSETSETGDGPMYDFSRTDALEGITHSLCTLG